MYKCVIVTKETLVIFQHQSSFFISYSNIGDNLKTLFEGCILMKVYLLIIQQPVW